MLLHLISQLAVGEQGGKGIRNILRYIYVLIYFDPHLRICLLILEREEGREGEWRGEKEKERKNTM